ncbi:hypothetical protein NUACC21_19280 [Scytonema sp. NUACC21]
MDGKTRYYLIACGTSEYLDKYDPLPSVNTDVETVVNLFTQHFGYERVLEDLQLNPEATTLKNQFADWLQDEKRCENDVVIFYYSGHGDCLPGDGHYLVMKDTIIDKIGTTALLTKDLVRPLINKGVKISQILYIIDTCHSGSGAIDVTNFALKVIQQYQPVEKETNIAVHAIAACRAKQTANEGVLSNALANAVKKLSEDVGLKTLGYINLDKLVEEIKQNIPSKEQRVQYSIAGTETSAKFLPILPKTLRTWEKKRQEFINSLSEILKNSLEENLFFINSFLLSSKFLEEFILDEPDLKDKLKDLSIKPVSDGICPLIACSEWCRQRFCDRDDNRRDNSSLDKEIEEWQKSISEYRKGVELDKIKKFVKELFEDEFKPLIQKVDLRIQIEIEPEVDGKRNTGMTTGSFLFNMNLWIESQKLPLGRFAENVVLKPQGVEKSDSLRICLEKEDFLSKLIRKARYSLPSSVKPPTIEIFLPIEFYQEPLEKICFLRGRNSSPLGKEYPIFINSFERYFDLDFREIRDEICEKKKALWGNNDGPNSEIYYIGTQPSQLDLEMIEESKAIAVWSRNKSKPLVEGDEGHIKISKWKNWPDKIRSLRKQEKDSEITLFWDDLYPKPSRRCRPLNTKVVE